LLDALKPKVLPDKGLLGFQLFRAQNLRATLVS